MKNLENSVHAACSICGSVEDLFELNGEWMCEDCLADHGYGICEECGEMFKLRDAADLGDDRVICEDCAHDLGYYQCEECGEWHHEDDFTVVNRDGWHGSIEVCSDCLNNNYHFYRCDDCGEWYDDRYVDNTVIANGDTVCQNCLDRSYMRCERCGEWYHEDDMYWNEERDAWYCEDCSSEIEEENDNSVEHNYYYKPTPVPKTHKELPLFHDDDTILYGDELLFGVELEVDKGRNKCDAIREISEESDDVYMKHDGSLMSNGFEIVTHPCSLEYHMKDFAWRRICQIAKDHGYKSHDARTCGLHVHVGRHQLGDTYSDREDTIANIVLMVDRHWDMLVKFSRRNDSQLHWAVRPEIEKPVNGDTENIARNKALYADNGNRYQAVNLCNRSTIEFRLFNGTLKRDTIIATLQIVNNICQYAKTHSTTECLTSKWEDIISFISYDELNTYVHERGISTADATTEVCIYDSGESTTPTPFREGDTVRMTHGSFYDDPVGQIGIVMIAEEDRCGVRFPALTHGHNLGGVLASTAHTGWWCNVEDLELAS